MLFMMICCLLGRATDLSALPECDLEPVKGAESEVYVVGISPGEAPFSFIGHSAYWVRDPELQLDHIVEFGAINSRLQEPGSALLLGTLRCWWHSTTMLRRIPRWKRHGRSAIAQRLDLPEATQDHLIAQLQSHRESADDALYDFHWFEQNCATGIRDVLDDSLNGQLSKTYSEPAPLSPREEVLRHLQPHLWAWLGLDLLAGPNADREISMYEAGFVPQRLTTMVDEMSVTWPDGQVRSLVSSTCVLNREDRMWAVPVSSSEVGWMWLLGLGVGLVLFGTNREVSRFGAARWATGLMVIAAGLLIGLLGVVAMGLASLSHLEEFNRNLNWLFVNPLAFALVGCGVAWIRGRSAQWMRWVTGMLAVLSSVGLIISLIGWGQPNLSMIGLFWPVLMVTAWISWRAQKDR